MPKPYEYTSDISDLREAEVEALRRENRRLRSDLQIAMKALANRDREPGTRDLARAAVQNYRREQ